MSESAVETPISGTAALLAGRYSGALYDLAEAEKTVDAVAHDLRAILSLCQSDAQFLIIASHPRLTRAQLVKVAGTLAETLKVNKLTAKFLALTAQHRRLSIIGVIADAFLAKLASKRGEFTASVRVASALSPQQSEQLASRLASIAGGKVLLNLREDKSLIGGFTAQLGSRLIDASVRSKLQRLERKLKSQAA